MLCCYDSIAAEKVLQLQTDPSFGNTGAIARTRVCTLGSFEPLS